MPPSRDILSTADRETLGRSLGAIREARQLSLAEVAEATGISTSFLSLVEKDRSDITIRRLVRLIEFYGISITDLLPGKAVKGYPEVIRSEDQTPLHSPAEGIDISLLTVDTRHRMMPMLLEFEPGSHLAEFGRHEGEEWVHVLEGRLRLELRDAEPRILEAGDSAYYPAERPHLFSNDDDRRRLRIICVDTPPTM
jgi:quercetin dioxygenase-like cupin family protein